MASGAGFQMDAVKNLKGNTGLLKKTEAFNKIRHNNFINAPKLEIEISPKFYDNLKAIKIERLQKEHKIKRILVMAVSTLVAFCIIGFLFISRR